MKKKSISFLFILLVIISYGCANQEAEITKYDYHFVGENDLWTADYKVTGEQSVDPNDQAKNTGHFDYVLTVAYKKDIADLENVKNLEINSTSSLKNSEYKLTFPEDGTIQKSYTIKYESESLAILEDDTIEVTIKADDIEQTLELTNEDAS